MFCTKCGAPLVEGAQFCVKCGARQAQEMRPQGEARRQNPGRNSQAGNEAREGTNRPVQNNAGGPGQSNGARTSQNSAGGPSQNNAGRQRRNNAGGPGQSNGARTKQDNARRPSQSNGGKTSRNNAGGAAQGRGSGGAPEPKKSFLLPILIIVAIAAVAAVAIMVLVMTGKIDFGSEKSGKAKTEETADISDSNDEETSSKKSSKNSKEKESEDESEAVSNDADSDSATDKEKDSNSASDKDKDSSDSATDKEKDSASASDKDKDSSESASDKEKDSDSASDKKDSSSSDSDKDSSDSDSEKESSSEAAETGELPKDYESLAKAVKERVGAELNLVSSDVSDYPNVKLYYSYNDTNGEPITITDPVTGIRESIAGGAQIERKVRSIQQLEGNQGLSIDIVADKSGSMSSDIYAMQNIMSEFVRNMDFSVGDAAELIAFDSYIMYMCTYTQDPVLLQNGISNMVANGDTALYDAIAAGITNASYQQGARCVIAFTDGYDNRSRYTPDEIIHQSIQKEVPVYIIGLGSADTTTLNRICEETGGKYWAIGSINDMSEVMEEIYSNQKSMYCIEYESDGSADPYAERSVSCIISDDDLSGTSSSDTFTATEALKEQHHESRYELVKADVSWTEANDLSIAKGGHLVTITTPEEQKTISDMAAQAGLKYIWIGGYTSVRNNTAYGHWVTGEPFDYTAWFPGEPSRNDTLDNEPEFYIMLWNVEGEWSWNDQRNVLAGDPDLPWFAGNIGYVIEYEN